MRARDCWRDIGGSVFLTLALLLGASTASAQAGFDDEFEEFEQNTTPATQPGPTAATNTTATSVAPTAATIEDSDDAFESDTVEAPRVFSDVEAIRRRRYSLHNTIQGPVGGFYAVDAGSAPSETFRVQLATSFFLQNGFLLPNDNDSRIGGTLSASWTPWEFLEFFASIQSYANTNTMERPQLFQVLGDSQIGAKGSYSVFPWLAVGGDLSVSILNTVGDIGVVGDSTSMGFRANASIDLRQLESVALPILARLNLQYWLDNSGSLIRDVEDRRYAALPDPMSPMRNEDRHLISRVERFALNINRVDRFNITLGGEFPIEAMPDFVISPIVEWRLGIPVNRQGYSCLYLADSADASQPQYIPAGRPGGGTMTRDDGCLANQGFSAFPMNLTLGAKVAPPGPVRGLSAFAAVDIGLTGTSAHVRELAATLPYQVMLGVGYAYDTRPVPTPAPVVRIERVEVPAAAAIKGRVRGLVVERGAETPVAGAVVKFADRDVTALSAGADGRFVSYEFDPGNVQIEVSHPDYNPGVCAGEIPAAGGDVEVRCELVALPRVGNVRGHVVNQDNAAVNGATIALTGAATRNITSDASGTFSLSDLAPGHYQARVEADGYLLKLTEFDVRPRETATPEITLVAKPRQATASLRRNEIVIRRQINFANDSDVIPDSAVGLLSEVADILLRNPQIARLEIQGHTDNAGSADHNQELSQRRADSVRNWLVAQGGIAGDRLSARGYGATRPLVPSITAAARARNRRVQFIVQTQPQAEPAPAQ